MLFKERFFGAENKKGLPLGSPPQLFLSLALERFAIHPVFIVIYFYYFLLKSPSTGIYLTKISLW
jgi:hypothetical protein